ncbi:MAG: hypothetical protein ABEJ28_12440 [Salinigranum sp.]
MSEKRTEACGRCAMSTIVDVAAEGQDDETRARSDPFAGSRIEVDEDEVRRASPGAWLAGLKRRLDRFGSQLTYGR